MISQDFKIPLVENSRKGLPAYCIEIVGSNDVKNL